MNTRLGFAVVFITIGIPMAFLAKAIATEVYKTVDENGNVTFTDNPPTGSDPSKVKIGPVNAQQATVLPPPEPAVSPEDETDEGEAVEEVPYSSSLITQPLDNAAIPRGQLEVVVQIGLKPPLQTGHQVKFFHNGRRMGPPTSNTRFVLTDLIRGEHKVKAQIFGADGKRKAETQTITFYVHRYTPPKPKKTVTPK